MKNKKVAPVIFMFLFSFQFLFGLTYFNFNTGQRNEVKNIDPKMSDVIIGNYTFPGAPGSIALNKSIRIGLLGDMEDITGDHNWKGALLAAREINEAGGITINSTQYYIGLAAEDTDEANSTLDVSKGINAANRIISYDPHFIIGGYRNESVSAYLEPIMDAQIPFLSTGIAANEFCENVNNSYDRYKYFFRVMPLNSSSLGGIIINYIGFLCTNLGITKVAILREDLAWTVSLSEALKTWLLSWGLSVVQEIAFPVEATSMDFNTYWNTIETSDVQLTIPIVSGSAAIKMLQQYRAVKPKCLIAGIDVLSQLDSFWDDTEGTCQYEIILQAVYRTAKTSVTIPFWDRFTSTYNMDPLYTGVGSYDAVRLLANVSESINSFNPNDTISELEGFNKSNPFIGAGGNLAFTKSHDLFEGYPYSYNLFCQWQLDGNKVVVPSPIPSTNPGYYPLSLSTGSISLPYWGINDLVAAKDIPETFILSSNADSPDKDGTFNLTWSTSVGADNYSIFIYDKNIQYISKRYLLDSYEGIPFSTTTFTISGLKTGKYYCIVAAYNATGERLSDNICVDVDRRPGNFTLATDADLPVDTDGTFNLTWSVSEGADNYSVYAYDGLITEINGSVTLYENQTATSPFLISGLMDGDYFYAVMAYNETGEKLSNSIYVKVRYPPGQFMLSSDAEFPDTDGNLTLTWTTSAKATSYLIFQYSEYITIINNSLSLIGTVQATNSSFEIMGLNIGFYYYIIQAYNGYNYTESNCIEVNIQFYDEITGYWELAPFIIDDIGGGHYYWSEVVALPWCSGSGTFNDPYIIECIKINGNDIASSIIIRESDVFFTIRNSSFFNAGDDENDDAGIKLMHVLNGVLISLNCSSNNANGIFLEICQNINVTSCSVNNNSLNGIYLFNCTNISIINNTDTISHNDNNGIHLVGSDNNRIIRNIINSNNVNGIFLDVSSDNNYIDWNTLLGNGEAILDLGQNNYIGLHNVFPSVGNGFPFDILFIVLIVTISIFAIIGAGIIIKKRISFSGTKEKEISEKKKAKIRTKLEEQLRFVDHLIKERQIKIAYKKLGKIKDTADQYDFFAIFNEANKKVDICKDIEAGIYREVPEVAPVTPVTMETEKKEKDYIPIIEKPKESSVFLSYSSLDTDRFQINRIAKELQRFPEINKVFYYTKDSGQNIVEYMEKTLGACNIFVLFCTEHSKKSRAVEGEWQTAYQLVKKDKMKIIPIYQDEEDVPLLLIPMLNVRYDKENFDGFINKLRQEILR